MGYKLIMQAYLIPVNQIFSIGIAEAIFHMPAVSAWICHTSLKMTFHLKFTEYLSMTYSSLSIKPVHAAGNFPVVMTVLYKLDIYLADQACREAGRGVCSVICYLLSKDFKQLVLRNFLLHLYTVHPSTLLLLHLIYYYHIMLSEFIGDTHLAENMLSQEKASSKLRKMFTQLLSCI